MRRCEGSVEPSGMGTQLFYFWTEMFEKKVFYLPEIIKTVQTEPNLLRIKNVVCPPLRGQDKLKTGCGPQKVADSH